jgi:hypothetical protein
MPAFFIWVILVALVYVGIVLYRSNLSWGLDGSLLAESFADGATVEDQVVSTYNTVLDRQPTAKELVDASRDIKANKLTNLGLRQRLMDSDEYIQLIKMQSNALTPELDRMLSDQATLGNIAALYMLERNKEIPPKLVLPYKDIFALLKYNPYAFRAFLRHAKYTDFEDDLMSTAQLDKDAAVLLFRERFKMEDLEKEADRLRAEDPAAAGAGAPSAAAGTSVARRVEDLDSDMSAMLASIQAKAKKVFDKDAKRIADSTDAEGLSAKIYLDKTHEGDMVLRPEYAWSVPMQRAPVCTTLGQPALKVAPLLENSKLLLGTPLEAAKDTQVGSIRPKFMYQEYIDTTA